MGTIEAVGILVGIGFGLFGSVFSIVQSFKQKRKDRMEDMKRVFLDKDIPRKTRAPFFEKFVRLGGNGLYAQMWLKEGDG
jgi:hypothetical protein